MCRQPFINASRHRSVSPTKICPTLLVLTTRKYAQLYWFSRLENMLNFYTLRSTLCASRIGVNLRARKLPVECWWNRPQLDIVVSFSVPFLNFVSWIIYFFAFKRMSKKLNKLCKNFDMLNSDYSKLDLVPGTGMFKILYLFFCWNLVHILNLVYILDQGWSKYTARQELLSGPRRCLFQH